MERSHRSFDVLTDLFDRVGLWKNLQNTVSMDFQPCHTPGEMSKVVYEIRTMGVRIPRAAEAASEVPRVRSGAICGVDAGITPETTCHVTGGAPPPPQGEAQIYCIYFPKTLEQLRCPVEGCRGGDMNWYNLQVHFVHHHVGDKIVILEGGNWHYPRLNKCDMFVSHKALNGRQTSTELC